MPRARTTSGEPRKKVKPKSNHPWLNSKLTPDPIPAAARTPNSANPLKR